MLSQDLPLRGAGIPVAILTMFILWSVMQLVPLPPEIWVRLPGREFIALGYDELGLTRPSLPISLDPDATLATMGYPLIPLFIMLLSIRIGRERLEKTLPVLVCAIALMSASLGGVQLFLGPVGSADLVEE